VIHIRKETDGVTSDVSVNPNSTIGELKEKLKEAKHMRLGESLYYDGKSLDESRSFRALGIKDGATLQIGASDKGGIRL